MTVKAKQENINSCWAAFIDKQLSRVLGRWPHSFLIHYLHIVGFAIDVSSSQVNFVCRSESCCFAK